MGVSNSPGFQIRVISATNLGQLAASMSPGAMADFSVGNWNWNLIETGGGSTSLSYTNKGYWDPFDRIGYHFGSGHNPERGVHMRYIDSANRFEDFSPPGVPPIQGPKHSYEHIAFQPRSGRKGVLYHWKKYSDIVERLDLETNNWDRIAAIPGSNFQVAGGLEWFPELYGGSGGLVHVDSTRGVSTWNSSNNRWDGQAAPDMGPYHNFTTYLPDQKVVLFGGGNDSRAVHQIDANRNITTKRNSPYKIGVDRKGIFMAQPGKKPTLFSYDNKIWEYDHAGDTWISAGSHNLYTTANKNWVAGISIPDYSCILFMLEKSTPLIKVYKFRSA